MVRKITVVLSQLIESVRKTEYTIVYKCTSMHTPSNIFFPPPPFFLCSDSEGKPTTLKFPARWARALPGGLQLQGILQSPAVVLASDLRRPDFLPTQLRWRETRQSSPGLLCWFCWSYWRNKWALGNRLVWTSWQTQTWKASRRVLFKSLLRCCWEGSCAEEQVGL